MKLHCCLAVVGVFAVISFTAANSDAQCRDPHCGGCVSCAPAVPVMIERTVMVPTYVTEKRVVHETVYHTEARTKTVTVNKCVPRQVEKTRSYTVMVPQQQTKTVNYVVCKPVYETKTREYVVEVPQWSEVEEKYTVRVPVWHDQERQYTVMVPTTEKRQGTRRVARCIPTTEQRTVRCDEGHWETQMVEVPCYSPCNNCGHCRACCSPVTQTVCRRVWMPNVVEKQVDVTVYKQVVEDVPYEYCVTVCKPETRTETVKVCSYTDEERTCTRKVCTYKPETRTQTYQVCKYVHETQAREVTCTVYVPQQKTETCTVTVYDMVPEERQVTYNVCVPEVVEKEINVCVCRMVPKTIQVPACGCY